MIQANAFDTLAHRLLDELDTRHDELLAELDALNERVDAVLSQYVTVRPEEPASTDIDAEELDELD